MANTLALQELLHFTKLINFHCIIKYKKKSLGTYDSVSQGVLRESITKLYNEILLKLYFISSFLKMHNILLIISINPRRFVSFSLIMDYCDLVKKC